MQIVFYGIWLILLAVFQPTLVRELAIWGIAPNLFLCFIVMTGFFRGKTEGAVCGMIFGLVYDLMIGRIIGVSSLSYLYIGFAAGFLSERFFSGGKRLAGTVTVAAGTLAAALIYYLARLMVRGDIGFVTAIFRTAFPEAIYNAVVGFLLAFPMLWLMKLLRLKRIS